LAALISLLTVISLSLLITRIATVALALTGLSRESAKFQARSAFTGVGFTTNEAEQVVSHPVRRRILMLLMLLGNVGVITTISSLILTFLNTVSNQQWLVRSLILGTGLVVLWILATSKWIDRYLSRLINWALQRWTRLNVQDYASLLRLSGDYTVMEMEVQPDDWLADRELGELGLRQEGVVVLGIQRENGRYVGAPKGHTHICPGDVLILYGRLPLLNELDQRGADWTGEQSHQKAVAQQQRNLVQQDREEAEDHL